MATKKRPSRRSRSSRKHGDTRARKVGTIHDVRPGEFVYAKGFGSSRTIFAKTPNKRSSRHGDKRKGSRKGKGSRRSRASRRR